MSQCTPNTTRIKQNKTTEKTTWYDMVWSKHNELGESISELRLFAFFSVTAHIDMLCTFPTWQAIPRSRVVG
jgi:hypothetical protein